jgi:urease accessory protein UreF
MGEIKDEDSLLSFLENELAHSLVKADLPVFREAWKLVCDENYTGISHLDDLAVAMKPSFELRKAGTQIGRQTWRLYGQLLSAEQEETRKFAKCSEFLTHYQSVVVCGLLSSIMHVPSEVAISCYAQQAVCSLCQACIKLIGFGPTQVQRVIQLVGTEIENWVRQSTKVDIADAGSASPRWDIASARHQYSERRLYIS